LNLAAVVVGPSSGEDWLLVVELDVSVAVAVAVAVVVVVVGDGADQTI